MAPLSYWESKLQTAKEPRFPLDDGCELAPNVCPSFPPYQPSQALEEHAQPPLLAQPFSLEL